MQGIYSNYWTTLISRDKKLGTGRQDNKVNATLGPFHDLSNSASNFDHYNIVALGSIDFGALSGFRLDPAVVDRTGLSDFPTRTLQSSLSQPRPVRNDLQGRKRYKDERTS